MQRVKLPLRELWEKKHQPKQVEEEIWSNVNYPILVRYPVKNGQVIYDNLNIPYVITREKKILKVYPKPNMAAKVLDIIYEGLRSVEGDFVIADVDEGLMLLHYDPHKKTITVTNLLTEENKSSSFPAPSKSGRRFFFLDGNFYLYSSGANMTWMIDYNANIKKLYYKEVRDVITRKEEITERLNTINRNLYDDLNILKNIHRVSINKEGNLVLNNFVLRSGSMGSETYILLVQARTDEKEYILTAIRLKGGVFRFGDGSEVVVNRCGLVILKSSHPNYSDIYVPTMLGHPLGLATKELFSGHPLFKKDKVQELTLEDVGRARLKVIKTLKGELGLTLKEAKDAVNTIPMSFSLTQKQAASLSKRLGGLGARVSTKSLRGLQTEIDPKSFFNTYIKAFIQHIINHAT